MSQLPIAIIGAGLSGLTLSRALKSKGISSVLFEKGDAKVRGHYAITLHPWAYQPLMRLLGMDVLTFKKAVAVDQNVGGFGKIHESARPKEGSFRVHQGALETLLTDGADIRWEHRLLDTPENARDSNNSNRLRFQGQQDVSADIIIGADGVHSTIRRNVLEEAKPKVLPYVTFNSKRRVTKSDYEKIYSPAMKDATTLEMRRGKTLLQISLIGHEKNGKDTIVNSFIGCTYSRPAHTNDKLHKPERSTTKAVIIPSELFKELKQLKDLPEPFSDAFDSKMFQKGRILHWLMRTTDVEPSDMHKLASQGIFLLGDAAHAQPIIGGNGANAAIKQALDLADHIAENRDFGSFIDAHCAEWQEGVDASTRRIAEMHGIDEPGHELQIQLKSAL